MTPPQVQEFGRMASRPQENRLLTRLLLYYKRLQLRNRQMKQMQKIMYGGGVRSFHAPLGMPLSQHLHVFTNPEALQTLCFRDFYGGFITWA